MSSVTKIPIMEIFGPTIQGEGAMIGQKTMFVRTGGCDYKCSWCDSKFTWDGSQKAIMMSVDEIVEGLQHLAGNNFNHVTISGGNPALIGQPMGDLIKGLHKLGINVGLETQGSKWQEWFYDIDDLTISPKPPSSGMTVDMDMLDEIMECLSFKPDIMSLKIVVFNDVDMAWAKTIFKRYAYNKNFQQYVQVGNARPQEQHEDITGQLLNDLSLLFEKVIKDPELNNVRPLPQLHTLVWQNRRAK